MSKAAVSECDVQVRDDTWKSERKLSENAERVLRARYLKKDEQGRVTESPRDLFRRVAKAIADAGANFIGMVFAPSPRQVTANRVQKIMALLNHKPAPDTVGVFVNTPAATVNRIADSYQLDWVQLSGDEPWEYCRELNRPIIKVIRVSRNYRPEKIIADLSDGDKILAKQRHIELHLIKEILAFIAFCGKLR